MRYPLRDEVARDYCVLAKQKEDLMAAHLIAAMKEQDKGRAPADKRFTKYTSSGLNSQNFLKMFFKDVLIAGGVNKKPYPVAKYEFSQTGPISILKAEYTVDGKTDTLSQARQNDIVSLFNSKSGLNKQRTDDWEERLGAIVTEEAGETILNLGLDAILKTDRDIDKILYSLSYIRYADKTQVFTNTGNDMDKILPTLSKSNKYEIDTTVTFKSAEPSYDDDDFEGLRPFYENIDWNFEHKNNLNDFHVATGTIKAVNYYNNDNSLPDNIMAFLIEDRIAGYAGYFPIYYSYLKDKVLLSSDLLGNPEGFYLKEPKLSVTEQDINDMARDWYETYMIPGWSEEQLKEAVIVGLWQSLKETQADFKGNMWYSIYNTSLGGKK